MAEAKAKRTTSNFFTFSTNLNYIHKYHRSEEVSTGHNPHMSTFQKEKPKKSYDEYFASKSKGSPHPSPKFSRVLAHVLFQFQQFSGNKPQKATFIILLNKTASLKICGSLENCDENRPKIAVYHKRRRLKVITDK